MSKEYHAMKSFNVETMMPFDEVTVRDANMHWTVRTYNLLCRYGYIDCTVSDLYIKVDDWVPELLRKLGLGRKTLTEIQERLQEYFEDYKSEGLAKTIKRIDNKYAASTGIAIGNSMAGDLFLGRPFEVGSFEKELNDIRAKNGWRITIEFTGTLIVTVFDKESGKKLAETGATSLLGILWALQQPLDSNNWLWNRELT